MQHPYLVRLIARCLNSSSSASPTSHSSFYLPSSCRTCHYICSSWPPSGASTASTHSCASSRVPSPSLRFCSLLPLLLRCWLTCSPPIIPSTCDLNQPDVLLLYAQFDSFLPVHCHGLWPLHGHLPPPTLQCAYKHWRLIPSRDVALGWWLSPGDGGDIGSFSSHLLWV